MPSKKKNSPWKQITWKTDKGLLKGQGFARLKVIYFSFPKCPYRPLGITRVLGSAFPAVNRQGREADRLSSTSPEIKNEWSYTSTPQYAFLSYTRKPVIFLTYPQFCAVKLIDSGSCTVVLIVLNPRVLLPQLA